jgi:hypothetical protein
LDEQGGVAVLREIVLESSQLVRDAQLRVPNDPFQGQVYVEAAIISADGVIFRAM